MPPRGPVPNFPLHDKIVLVTGGGPGIGLAFSKACHALGARVVIGDLKLVPEAETYISSTDNETIVFEHCDVSSWRDLHNVITASVRHFGAVPDVYAPVAGVFEPRWSNFWDDTENDDGYKLFRINVDHPIKLTRLAMRALLGAGKQGVLCLVASTAGIRASYFASLYTASKHAIVGFAKAMGQADGDEGVKIVCILPGTVITPLWTDREDQVAAEAKFVMRKYLRAEDVAEVMVKMVESEEFGGGACVLKTPYEESVLDPGHVKQLEATNGHDPSPRPDPDLGRIRGILDQERERPWSC
ncbi:Enoyl-(Acyl carrier protein) reductase [Teratosphaeria destructans]|uniref:Enoyl-(Acyl carrier protein) reductase n=1 Tax=Teratosphaeria destructans TaxID=418781 RepID=A0A9W7SW97_9PEZI|nr:Enoyl-(Acyl carrier protein) reductase [Teratosphaeria destructans]